MLYSRIMGYVASQLWAIDSDKLTEIVGVLAMRAGGESFTPEEIQARIGGTTRQPTTAGRNVAVIPIYGTIAHRMGSMSESSGGTSTEKIGAMFRQAMADESVGTILLDVDSGGGTVTGVPELADEIYAARGNKRIFALVNGNAGSAAYWLASQADEIISIPSGMAGSVGVYTIHECLADKLAQEGVKVTLISAGKHKVSGNPLEPLSDEEKAVIQGRVDDAYSLFVKAVARGRGVSVADVKDGYGQGRMLSAKDAKAANLIDRIATVEDTVSRLLGRSGAAMQAEVDLPPVVAEAVPEVVAVAPAPVADERLRWRLR